MQTDLRNVHTVDLHPPPADRATEEGTQRREGTKEGGLITSCLLYTSDAADE